MVATEEWLKTEGKLNFTNYIRGNFTSEMRSSAETITAMAKEKLDEAVVFTDSQRKTSPRLQTMRISRLCVLSLQYYCIDGCIMTESVI